MITGSITDCWKSDQRIPRTASNNGNWSSQMLQMPARKFCRKFIQFHMRDIWATTRRSRNYSRIFIGQITQSTYEILYWDVRSANQKRASIECLLDSFSHYNFQKKNGETSALTL